MKIIKILLLLLSCTINLVSCDMDVKPENAVTFENYFRTDKDLQTFLYSIQDAYRGSIVFKPQAIPQILSFVYDKLDAYQKTQLEWTVSDFTPMHASTNWSGIYTIISLCNTLNESIEKANISKDRKNYYYGQIHFYRAIAYFKLAEIWGECPIIKSSRTITSLAKSSIEDVLSYSQEEINKAIDLLPLGGELKDASGKSVIGKEIPSKEIAYALKTDIYMWSASVLKNNELCETVISSSTKIIENFNYQLENSPENVCKNVINGNGNSSESIFVISFNHSEATFNFPLVATYFVTYPLNPKAGRGDVKHAAAAILQSTVNNLYPGEWIGTAKNGIFKGDRRRLSYFYKMDDIAENDSLNNFTLGYAYPYKFRNVELQTSSWNLGQFRNFSCDANIYRLSEIILLRAEAYARLGKNDLAIADLNKIRRRAYGDNSADYKSSEGDLRYAIFKEREKEFLFEERRYFDVVRNGYWKTELSDFHKDHMTQADVDDGALYMPVGQGAFENNTLMTQNKYWLSRY